MVDAPRAGATSKRPAKAIESSDDEQPLMKRARPSTSNGAKANTNGLSLASTSKAAITDDSDSDEPLAKKPVQSVSKIKSSRPSNSRAMPSKIKPDTDSDSDVPLSKSVNGSKKRPATASAKKTAAKKPRKEATPEEDEEEVEEEEGEDEDDEDAEEEEDEGDGKRFKVMSKGKAAKAAGGADFHSGRGGKKWDTLYHTGPRFPDPYTPLPEDVTMLYNGKSVRLPPESEEVAMFYAVKLETQHTGKDTFDQNFFKDFKDILKKYPPLDGTSITSFAKCDFTPMHTYWKGLKDLELERKKKLAPSARKKELEAKKVAEAAMKTCIVDGAEQKVGNVVAEPPGLFLGRGAHPKTGMVKRRIRPEDITINHTLNDPEHPPPAPPLGHKWGGIIENKSVTWLAYWQENVNGQYKYMYLDATSKFKTNSDRDKYEKARELDKHIVKLRAQVEKDLNNKHRPTRQIATVVWLIDNYSLRVGNEKGEDEAATYGACSLLVEHAQLIEPKPDDAEPKWIVKLEFLGKDSMKFEERLDVPKRVFDNFKMFMRSAGKDDKTGEPLLKEGTDMIFHTIDTTNVNQYIQDPVWGMQGLSAKVFRTYNASTTFQGLLNRTEEWLSERPTPDERAVNPQNLKIAYNEANRQVAILCNHQKTVNPLQHEKTMQRTEDKMFAIRYERFKERQKLLTHHTAADLKKTYPAKTHDFGKHWSQILEPVDITKDQIKEHEEATIVAKKNRIQSAFDRQELEREYQEEQAKLSGAAAGSSTRAKSEAPAVKGKKKTRKDESEDEDIKPGKKSSSPKTQKDVDEEKQALDAQLKTLEQERKSNRSSSDSVNVASSAKKILGKIEALKKQEAERVNKENTKEVSLGTSKLNYIDPRVTLAWLKKFDNKLQAQAEAGVGKKGLKASPKKTKGSTKIEAGDSDLSDDEDVKPSKGKGRAKGKGTAAVKEEVDARAKSKAKNRGDKNTTGLSDKMELDLKVMSIGAFFPMTLQKKFKWAATDDDGKDLSPDWVFVKDAESKMRTMNSAIRDDKVANKEKEKDENAFRPQHKSTAEPPRPKDEE